MIACHDSTQMSLDMLMIAVAVLQRHRGGSRGFDRWWCWRSADRLDDRR